MARPTGSGAAGSAPVLSLRDVGMAFRSRDGDSVQAVSDVSLDVEAGEFISIVGPSGCGKTTLLKMCANLETPTAGSIRFRGADGGIPAGAFGMVFQSPALFGWRTVRSNIAMPQHIIRTAGKLNAEASRRRVEELIELMRLPEISDRYPWELSGGMQQRVSIARALFLDPPVLLMDEPFGALDAMTREELNLHFERIQMTQRKTVVFVTHSISEAVILSDRIVVMSAGPGRVVEVVDNTLPRPRDEEVLASAEFAQRVGHVRGLLRHAKEVS